MGDKEIMERTELLPSWDGVVFSRTNSQKSYTNYQALM